MNKKELEDFEQKLFNYDYEIIKLKKKIGSMSKVLASDSVRGSSREFPFEKKNFEISGVDKKIYQLEKRLKVYKNKKTKLIKEMQYKINNLENRMVADIIERKYILKQTWSKISRELNYAGEEGARNYFNRYVNKK